MDLTKEAEKSKLEIQTIWKSQILKRRKAYWDYYRRKETLAVYNNEIEKDHPRMPRRLQPKEIRNEPIEEHNIRKSLAMGKFRAEIKLTEIRQKRNEREYQEIDENMKQLLSVKYTNKKETLRELSQAWTEECKEQESKSIKIFRGKREWLIQNLTEKFRTTKRYQQTTMSEKRRHGQRKNLPTWKREDNIDNRSMSRRITKSGDPNSNSILNILNS